MSVKEYTKEFYRLDIRSGHVDYDVEKIARYINGLRSRIQDDISFVKLESALKESYQYALKTKEILTKKHEKRQEVEVVDSREVEVDLMEKVADLTVLYKIRENMKGRMMIKARPNGKVVILTKEVLVLTKEEVIVTLEKFFMVIILDVVKKGTNPLNVDPLKMGKVTEIL